MTKIKDLKEKNTEELTKMLREAREKLRDLNFKVTQKQLKNVREIRKIKKSIARMLTLIGGKI